MDFQDFLRERLKKQFSRQLFKMIPIDLHECLKKILCLKFNEEPPYDYILYCLNLCFEKVVNARIPIGPPSNHLQMSIQAVQSNDSVS